MGRGVLFFALCCCRQVLCVVRDVITKGYVNSKMASLQWRSRPIVNLLLAIDGGHTLSLQMGDYATTLSGMILNNNIA